MRPGQFLTVTRSRVAADPVVYPGGPGGSPVLADGRQRWLLLICGNAKEFVDGDEAVSVPVEPVDDDSGGLDGAGPVPGMPVVPIMEDDDGSWSRLSYDVVGDQFRSWLEHLERMAELAGDGPQAVVGQDAAKGRNPKQPRRPVQGGPQADR